LSSRPRVVPSHALLQTSRSAFLKNLVPQEDETQNRRASLGTKFRSQLDELMATLNTTQPHYGQFFCVDDDFFVSVSGGMNSHAEVGRP
jgi:hypothetical protein